MSTVYVDSKRRSDKFKEEKSIVSIDTQKLCLSQENSESFFEPNRIVSVDIKNVYFILILFYSIYF